MLFQTFSNYITGRGFQRNPVMIKFKGKKTSVLNIYVQTTNTHKYVHKILTLFDVIRHILIVLQLQVKLSVHFLGPSLQVCVRAELLLKLAQLALQFLKLLCGEVSFLGKVPQSGNDWLLESLSENAPIYEGKILNTTTPPHIALLQCISLFSQNF